jgi:hypothetical protein
MVEYVVITAAIAAALFAPVPSGQTDVQGGQPVWKYLSTSVGIWYERFSYAISLP